MKLCPAARPTSPPFSQAIPSGAGCSQEITLAREKSTADHALAPPDTASRGSLFRRFSVSGVVTATFAITAAANMTDAVAEQRENPPLSPMPEVPAPPPLPERMLSPFRPLTLPPDETRTPAGSVQRGKVRWLLFKDRAGRLYRTEVAEQ